MTTPKTPSAARNTTPSPRVALSSTLRRADGDAGTPWEPSAEAAKDADAGRRQEADSQLSTDATQSRGEVQAEAPAPINPNPTDQACASGGGLGSSYADGVSSPGVAATFDTQLFDIPDRGEEFWLSYRNLDCMSSMDEVEMASVLLYADTGDLDGYAELITMQRARRLFGIPERVNA